MYLVIRGVLNAKRGCLFFYMWTLLSDAFDAKKPIKLVLHDKGEGK